MHDNGLIYDPGYLDVQGIQVFKVLETNDEFGLRIIGGQERETDKIQIMVH